MATIGLGSAIQRGLASARPASGDATKAGQLYYATDTGVLSHDNGTAWINVALLSADLTAIAALTPSNDDVLQRKAGAWANRTLAQLRSDLALNPLTTQDDLYVGGASGAPARLAKGTDGQVLTVDPTTHHLVWATPTGGYSDPLTTKGDLVGRSSSATGRLAVGSNGQVLTADSAQTLGVKWATPAGGGGGALVGAHAYTNSSPTIADSTLTAIPLELEQYDTDGMHDNSTNNTRLTVQTAGKYRISGFMQFSRASPSGTMFAVSLRLNGATQIARARFFPSSYPAATVTTTADLAMGDYIELMALHVEGTGVGLIVGGPYPHLAMELLG